MPGGHWGCYRDAKRRIRDLIDCEQLAPGDRLPPTPLIGEQLGVSLGTAHRALQELSDEGLLARVQGQGTFVARKHSRNDERAGDKTRSFVLRVPEATKFDDLACRQLIAGVHEAVAMCHGELKLVTCPDRSRGEHPARGIDLECEHDRSEAPRKRDHRGVTPARVSIGTQPLAEHRGGYGVSIDDEATLGHAIDHLRRLQHRRIALLHHETLGPLSPMHQLKPAVRSTIQTICLRHDRGGNRIDPSPLQQALTAPDRPTAIITDTYHLGLCVIETCRRLDLAIPDAVSLICVDDCDSAEYLKPSATTVARPISQLGHAAVDLLLNRSDRGEVLPRRKTLQPDLIIRRSTAPAPGKPRSASKRSA